VQPPGGHITQHQREHFGGREIGVRPGRKVVAGKHQRRAADAPQRHAALTILRRVERVLARQLAGRLLQRTERTRHPAEHLLHVELTGDDQRRVVGLVVLAVEGLQARDVDVFDIAARAYRFVAVVVPVVHHRQRALQQDAAGAVLAAFHLVAHHRHLGVEVLAGDVAVHHRIGQPIDVPLQVVVVGRETGGVVGAVEEGAAVGGQAPLLEIGPHLRVFRRALEHHVFKQVGHAGLAVVLVPRADVHGQVHGGRRLRIVGHQQQLQAIRQPVFIDAFDRLHRDDAARQALRQRRRCHRGSEPQQRQRTQGCGDRPQQPGALTHRRRQACRPRSPCEFRPSRRPSLASP
jgi:hypothetical protein